MSRVESYSRDFCPVPIYRGSKLILLFLPSLDRDDNIPSRREQQLFHPSLSLEFIHAELAVSYHFTL